MKHILFDEPHENYPIAILAKQGALMKREMERHYIEPLLQLGAARHNVVALSLATNEKNQTPAKLVKEYVEGELLPLLKEQQTRYVYVTDSAYYKHLTKAKPDAEWGNVLPCVIPGYEDIFVTMGVNHQQLIFNPGLSDKLQLGLIAIASHARGGYKPVGQDLLRDVTYVYRNEVTKAKTELEKLMDLPELTCDIEGFSLSMFESGIATICFGTSSHDGLQIQCDYQETTEQPDADGNYGVYVPNPEMRDVLKDFFTRYKGRITYHRANHDVKVLIYTLWMTHDLDRDGMFDGLDIMTPRMDDTKVIAYLALNSTAKVSYGLKDLAQQHAGSWAQDDIKDIRKIPLNKLMQYNMVDGVATWWVKEKLYPKMVADGQQKLYEGLMLESLALIVHIELVGMPMCPKTLLEVEQELLGYRDEYAHVIASHAKVLELNTILQTEAMIAANAKLKVKQHPLSHFKGVTFNPGSPQQMAKLLYELIGLPIIDKTKTGQPATGTKIIKRLMDHHLAASFKDLLQALVDFSAVDKVLTSFIPAFKAGRLKADGRIYLHGSFNLGGTISGRLSSSDPNLQNLPAGSKYGKAIKRIFQAAIGWVMGGADFAALEDRINALLTRDPNKIKVYTDGYDGHSLRAFSYWPDKFPGIMNTVESINSIQDLFPSERGDSKAPSFLLQYGGSYLGLMKNVGFPKDEAQRLEKNYQNLYAASMKWVENEITKATKCGYVELAFGLRLRTPMLGATITGLKCTPKEAAAEARSAGNAVSGQSWGLLNNRAAVAFMKRARQTKWARQIHIVALIHDAIYPLLPDDPECIAWANNALCEEMSWQDDPLIRHDIVKIGANLDLFWPSWKDAVTLDYPITVDRLIEQCKQHGEKIREKQLEEKRVQAA